MKISATGLNLVKQFEGCLKQTGDGTYKPYVCPAGVLTIGWGHTNHHGRQFNENTRWTKAQCDTALAEDMAGFEKAVERLVKVPLSQNQFDALVSFAYNCGEGNLSKSTLLRKLNAGDYDGAADQFAAWNKGGGKVLKGLVRRRAAEAALFRSTAKKPEVEPPPKPPAVDPMPQQADPPAQDRPSFLERIWMWLTGGGLAGAAAYFTDWRVVALLLIAFAVVMVSLLWLMGVDNVRRWIRGQVNR